MTNYKPCPQCSTSNAQKLNFTWWGGAIGPRILSHVKCGNCGKKYNGKTGGDNTTNIIIYSLVVGVICFVLFFGFALAFVMLSR